MEHLFGNFIVDGSELLDYLQYARCSDVCKDFISQINFSQDGDAAQSIVKKGFGKIIGGVILLDPVVKLIFDNVRSAAACEKIAAGFILTCPNMIIGIREKRAKKGRYLITVAARNTDKEQFTEYLTD